MRRELRKIKLTTERGDDDNIQQYLQFHSISQYFTVFHSISRSQHSPDVRSEV